ncbi:glucuronate isomerase [Pseudonocardia sp. CA-107938]|uniref:glucuronate isomerase n=1 Tax=Pseudonocardia sp. CA-107938 TaxID=3240021 RepID=UPI003D8B5CA7
MTGDAQGAAERSAQRPHPDRLLPADPSIRAIARRLYEGIRDLPIISPHGHVPPQWIAENTPFGDPTSLLISPDHYVVRLLHAAGVPLSDLGAGSAELTPDGARAAWRALCTHWSAFRGTPSRFWLESELSEIFGVTERPSAASADAIYDRIAETLQRPDFRPRELLARFGIEVLATTDDPCDDLAAHAAIRDDASVATRVLPTFRPDRYLEPARADWPQLVEALGGAADTDTGDFKGFIAALEARRRYFVDHGAVSADHSHPDIDTTPLDLADAERIFTAARAGRASAAEATALRRHLLLEMARMSVEDGLVMTLHPGIYRNHHTPTFERFGADVGCDIPTTVEFTRALQPLLARYGTADGFHLVLFTVDETVYSREIAPLAGFYPSVFAGVPWWFLDAPEAIRRFRGAVTETAGFSRTSGFIDDTRAFCSIPARHDMSRRLDSAYLAELVATHRLDEDEAAETAHDLVTVNPRVAFKL